MFFPQKTTKMADFLQQIPHNSRTDSPFEQESGSLGAGDRAGEDAALSDCAGTNAVCFPGTELNFGQKSLFLPKIPNKSPTTPEPQVRSTWGRERWMRVIELERMPREAGWSL